MLRGRGAYLVEYEDDGTVVIGLERETTLPNRSPEISLYPNPSTEFVRFVISAGEMQHVTIGLFDLLGRRIGGLDSHLAQAFAV